jgi:hypothetical protein
MKASVMAEFVDIDRGTPVGRLMEVAGLVTSLCRGALIRLRPAKDLLAPVRGFRTHGLTIDVGDAGEEAAAYMRAFGEQAKGAATALMAFGLPSERFFEAARGAGLSHAAVRAEAPGAKRAAA